MVRVRARASGGVLCLLVGHHAVVLLGCAARGAGRCRGAGQLHLLRVRVRVRGERLAVSGER